MLRSSFKLSLILFVLFFSHSIFAQDKTIHGHVTSFASGSPQSLPGGVLIQTLIKRLYNPATGGETELGRSYFVTSTNEIGVYQVTLPCDPTHNIHYLTYPYLILADGSLDMVGGPSTGYAGEFSCGFDTYTLDYQVSSPALQIKLLNGGPTGCPTQSLGGPVNVANGNMWLSQSDYVLPGAGPRLQIARTYNSVGLSSGIFGDGWTSNYDAKLLHGGTPLIQIDLGQGRIIAFFKDTSTSPYVPMTPDFHGQLIAQSGEYKLTLKEGDVYEFSSSGRLLWQQDPNGNQTTFTYNGSNILTSVTDPFGRTLDIDSNANGKVTEVSDALGTIATYDYYSGTSQLKTVTYHDGSKYKFEYTTIGGKSYLTTVKDALDNILETHGYDSLGRATTSERQGGVDKYTFDYSNPSYTTVTDALDRVTKYYVDSSAGRSVITKTEGLCGCGGSGSEVTEYFYDNRSNLIRRVDALSHEILYTYDADGNRLTTTDATGTVTFTYNALGELLTGTDQLGGVTTNTYDTHGNLLTVTDALNHTTTFTPDSRGQLASRTDARGKVTTFTWDSSGRLTQIKDALDHTSDYAYDARARLTSKTNALGQTTGIEYDLAGRPNKITFPDDNFVSYDYDLAGRRTKVTDARGHETNFAYDDANRLTSITDALSHVTSFGYDLMSNQTSATDALGRVTDFEYDDFNRLKAVEYPPATSGARRLQLLLEYDADGNLKKKTSAGRETTYNYDEVNRLTSTTDPADQETQFEYNERSQTTGVIDALNQHYTFAYDPIGRPTGKTRAGVTMTYTYDEVGNRVSRTDYNGAETNYAYNDLNLLTTITYPDSTGATYAYDALLRLSSATNENGSVTFSYNNRGRVSSSTDVQGQTLTYQFDAGGNRTGTALNGSNYASFVYDDVNRLTRLSDSANLIAEYSYDDTNKLSSRILANGVVSTYEYDDLDRLTHLNDSGGAGAILDNHYSYNAAGQITQKVDLSSTAVTYEYDQVDRLTGNDGSYSYDAVGNREGGEFEPFNRLVSNGFNYAYDDNGNELSKHFQASGSDYSYDFENRLKQAVFPGPLQIHPPTPPKLIYKYDALGRRVERILDRSNAVDDIQKFVYDGQEVIQDLDDNDRVVTSYLNGPGIDNKIRQTDGTNGNLYFTLDHLGSTTALTDDNGQVAEGITYDSFGNSSGSSLTRYTYTGREYDTDSGLYHYRARQYDPEIGRFTTEDPIGFAGGDVNLYGYVWQNPINHRDPLGLDGWGNNLADAADRKIESLRRWLQPNPDAINYNTAVNYTFNNFDLHGFTNLFRVGSGLGNALFNPCAAHPLRDAYDDYLRAEAIASILALPALGAAGSLEALEAEAVESSSGYMPTTEAGGPLGLPMQKLGGVDVPTPLLEAEGPHTTLGSRIGSDGVMYRQSAEFNGPSWPKANGLDVPSSRVDWTDHGRPMVHSSPHQHILTPGPGGTWQSGPATPFWRPWH